MAVINEADAINVIDLKIKRMIESISKKSFVMPVMWYDQDNNARGAMTKIYIEEPFSVKLEFNRNASHVPDNGIPLLLRTHLFLTPITAIVSKKGTSDIHGKDSLIQEDSKVFIYIDNIQFLKVNNNKRKYPRFSLKKSIEAQMMIGNNVFTIEIMDISKDGIGFTIDTERNLSGSTGKRMFVQFQLKNDLIKINGNIAWINRSGRNEYMGGALLYPSLKETDILTDIMLNNIYESENDLLDLMFESGD